MYNFVQLRTALVVVFFTTISYAAPEKLATTALKTKADPNVIFVVLSIDGFGKNVYLKNLKEKNIPNLEKLVQQSVLFTNAQALMPSVTLPNHVSMIAGVTPDEHKILWNEFDSTKPIFQKPTIFELLFNGGAKSAMIVAKEKFKQIYNPKFISYFQVHSGAEDIAKDFGAQLAANSSQFFFLHFAEPDVAGHKYGWLSEQQSASVAKVDRAAQLVFTALQNAKNKKLYLIITADHGGHDKAHGTNSPADLDIFWVYWTNQKLKPGTIDEKIINSQIAATVANFFDLDVPRDYKWDKPINLR